jgi:CheY-like chemotaxis protein
VAQRILMVDDEPRVLDGLRRNLASHYELEIALSGTEGLQLLEDNRDAPDPFAVIVSDMMMPGMNGAEFLAQATKVAPDAVLMLLSGQADLRSTVAAVNSGSLFRFIGKPCSPQDLRTAIDDALRQYQLVHAERLLLEHTLSGAVEVLVEALAMASPEAGSRTRVVAALVEGAAGGFDLAGYWELPMAAMLSQLGLISIPTEVLARIESGTELTAEERARYDAHPRVAHDLLVRIPRLERIARWVGGQPVGSQQADSQEESADPATVELQELLSRQILDGAVEFLNARDRGERSARTAHVLTTGGRYRPEVVEALRGAAAGLEAHGELRDVLVADLRLGMVFEHDVKASSGVTLVRKGDTVTENVRLRLRNFASSVGVEEPIRVFFDG